MDINVNKFFDKQLKLKNFSERQLDQLLSSKVLFIGMGGLGNPAAVYLLSVGIGCLTFADFDKVEFHNLHRQFLFNDDDIGSSKAVTAANSLQPNYPHAAISVLDSRMDERQLFEQVKDYDLVMDCSDNFETRYIVNDVCIEANIPLVSGSASEEVGQVISFQNTAASPCYECLFPRKQFLGEESCDRLGIMTPVLGVIGSMMALTAVNLLLNPQTSISTFTKIDSGTMKITQSTLQKDTHCEACST